MNFTAFQITLDGEPMNPTGNKQAVQSLSPVKFARYWLDETQVHSPRMARFLCRTIPAQCPFERDVVLLGRKVAHIPPLCKLNPFFEQLVGLRFRALCYLVNECGEDVSVYC